MRQLVFAGEPYITGTPSPEVEALILVAMTVVFTLLARWMIHRIERMARVARLAVDPLAVSAITTAPVPAPVPSGLGQLDGARFDPARTEGAGIADTIRSLRTALLLGWRIESNWTDPTLFVIYTVAKPVASLLLLVVMIQIIGGAASESDADVRDPRQRAVGDGHRRDRRARPGPCSTTASGTGCSSTSP